MFVPWHDEIEKMSALTDEDIRQFNHEGYLVFESLLDDRHNERIKRDVDLLMEDRKDPNKPAIPMRYPELGLLTSEPAIVDRVASLMVGEQFVHHHIHATCHMSGEPGVAWHPRLRAIAANESFAPYGARLYVSFRIEWRSRGPDRAAGIA